MTENETVVGSELVDEAGDTVAIVGSRSFMFESFPERAVEMVGEALVDAGWSVSEVVSGGAEGADSAGEEWANRAGVPVTIHEPDWDKHGKAAGMIRNSDIIQDADRVLAIWNGSSGTQDSVAKARSVLDDDSIRLVEIGDGCPSLEEVSPRSL